MDVRIRETKTKGVVNIAPVKTSQNCLNAAVITSNAMFRLINRHENVKNRLSDKSIALIVKVHIRKIGLDVNDFAAHSFRRVSTSAVLK